MDEMTIDKELGRMFNLDSELGKMLKDFLRALERKIIEGILYDILCNMYFLDCNKQCNYDKMTGAEIVKIYHEELGKIEKRYNYSLSDEVFGLGRHNEDDYD